MSAQSFLAKEGARYGILGNNASLAVAAPIATGNYQPTAHTDASRIGWWFDRTAAAEGIVATVMGSDMLTIGVLGTSVSNKFIAPVGGPGAPTYTFAANTTDGLYHAGAGQVNVAIAGVLTTTFAATSLTSTVPFIGPAGTAGAPSFATTGNATSGVYSGGANDVAISTNGVLRWDVSTTAVTSTLIGIFPAATTAMASIRLPHGVAPTSPVNGDMWTTTAGLFYQINGSTVSPATTSSGAATQVAYFSSSTSITSNAAFTFDATTGIALAAPLTISGPPASGSPTRVFSITPGTYTALTASTEFMSFLLLNSTQEFATGALGVNRQFNIRAPTYAFVGASVLSNAVNFNVVGSPNGGANATVTTSTAACFGGTNSANVLVANTITGTVSNSASIMAFVQTGATLNVAVRLPSAPQASASVANLAVGSGAFDGATSGFFVGSANGTQIGVNSLSTFTGSLLDCQNAGSSVFKVSSINNAGNGLQIVPTVSGSGVTLQCIGGTNEGLTLTSKGQGATILKVPGNNSMFFSVNGATRGTITNNTHTWATGTLSNAAATQWVLNVGALTTATASTESQSAAFNISANKQWATGTLAVNRDFVVNSPTYAFVGASSTTYATAVSFTGSPLGGTNATLVTSVGLTVGMAAAGTATALTGTITNSETVRIFTQTGATNNIALRLPSAPQASANVATAAFGSGAFDGSTTGFFVGSASGTVLGINAVSGYAGNLIDAQVAGVSVYKVDATGIITSAAQFLGATGSAAAVTHGFSGGAGFSGLGMYRVGVSNLGFAAAGSLRLNIDASAITCTTNRFEIIDGAAATPSLTFASGGSGGMYKSGNGIGIAANGTDAALLTTTSAAFAYPVIGGTLTALDADYTTAFGSPYMSAVGAGTTNFHYVAISNVNSAAGSVIAGAHTRSTGTDANTIVQNGDSLLSIIAYGADGAAYQPAAAILMTVSGTPGAGDMPGLIVFATTPDGSTTLTSALAITNTQAVVVASGKDFQVGNAFVAGVQVNTGYIVIKDSTGTSYKVNCNL